MNPSMREKGTRDKLFLKMFLKGKGEVTQEELEYFRRHPDEIDEITAPVNVHKLFLLYGALSGILLVALSKVLKFSFVLYFAHGYLQEFLVDVVFEIGVALIGAGVTAYLLGILLNTQQENAERWRTEIRSRIREPDNR
jgi:hypothetical protein